jgi:outer membrane protein OmpU
MNKLKKVGLTALAGSMVAFSAQALDMSVSGTAKITYVDEGEGSAGNVDVTGNPYGFDQTIAFNGSGETPLGTLSLMHVANTNGSRSSSLISIDMGDAGKISLDAGVGAEGAGTIKDMMPRAAGAEQSWDDTDGDAYFINTASQGAWGYSNSVAGFDLSIGYAKNGGGNAGDDGNVNAGDDSDKSFAITTSSLVDGVTLGFGMAEVDSTTSVTAINSSTAFAKYAVGPATLGLQWTDIDNPNGTADAESMLYGIAFNINENASISFNQRDVELGDTGGTSDQEDTGIAASYTMGNMTLSAFNNQSDNVGGTSGKEDEVTQVTMSFAF